MRGRCRWSVVVVVAVGLGGLGAGGTAAAAAAGATPERLAVLQQVPEGWYLLGAQAPRTGVGQEGAPFYAKASGDGAALTVGPISCEDGCPTIEGRRKDAPGLPGGELVRNGRFAWVTWANEEAPGGDAGNFVAARDLTDDQVVAAARAAHVDEYGGAVAIEPTGLPDGVQEIARSRAGLFSIPYGVEQITLLRADGAAAVDVWTYVADRDEMRAQRFWSQQAKLMVNPPQPPAGLVKSRRTVELVEHGRRATVVVGAADRDEAKSIAGRLRPATDTRWQEFRGELAELPAAAILPGAQGLRDPYLVDGYAHGLRWVAVAATTDAGPNEFHYGFATADHGEVQKSSGLLYAGEPVPADVLCGALEPWNLRVGELPPAMIALGLAPVATERVTFQLGAASPVEATLGPVTPDGQHRYVSGVVPVDRSSPRLFAAATAYDGSGASIAATSQFGILTCAT